METDFWIEVLDPSVVDIRDMLIFGPLFAIASGRGSVSEARDVFWRFYPDGIRETKDKLGRSLTERVLTALDLAESGAAVPYQLDEVPTDKLMVYIHIAAAKAMALRSSDRYHDDATILLEAIWKAYLQTRLGSTSEWIWEEATPAMISTWAVVGLVSADLSKFKSASGQFQDALHLQATSAEYLSSAAVMVELALEQPYEGYDALDWAWLQAFRERYPRQAYLFTSETQVSSEKTRPEPVDLLGMDSGEVVQMFEALQNGQRKGTDWKQVAKDCDTLATRWKVWVDDAAPQNELVRDAEGKEWRWIDFWRWAQGRAEGRLSPDELRAFLDQSEDETAGKRLRQYFFGENLWGLIPERAQRSLVDADRSWFSTSAGRMEACLADLQVAAESMCYSYFWVRLEEQRGNRNFLAFVRRELELQKQGYNPSLRDYIWALSQQFFWDFVAYANLDSQDHDFLKRDLPDALSRLRQLRNRAEHEPLGKLQSNEVAPIFQELMGLGKPGILPWLAQVERKLRQSGRKASDGSKRGDRGD